MNGVDVDRRRWLGACLALGAGGVLAHGPAGAQAPASAGEYAPRRGQMGKDVIWIPTPDEQVRRMLRLAQVTPSDYVIDLGSGDGKIVIAAAREGAQGLGIEYNPDMVALSRRLAQQAGVAERARFEKADIFESDFSRATVLTMYLLPHLNLKLRPRILALKPGTRVASHEFRMGRWAPDESSRIGHAWVHLWLVPANAGGEWDLRFTQKSGPVTARLTVEQTFQNFNGTVAFKQFATAVREPKVAGDQLRFGFIDEDGHLRRFVGQIAGAEMKGTVYDLTANGARSDFHARRLGAAPAIGGSGPAADNEAESLGNE